MKKLIITVQDSKVALIIQTIVGEIESFSMETLEDEGRGRWGKRGITIRRPNGMHRPATGEKNAHQIMMEIAKGGKAFTKSDISSALKKEGYSPATASPTITAAVRNGKIAKIGYNLYQINIKSE